MTIFDEGCGRRDREYRLDWCSTHNRSVWECFDVARVEAEEANRKLDSTSRYLEEREKKILHQNEILSNLGKELADTKLQIDELRKEVERLKGPCTCEHDPENAGGACGTCHAEALMALEKIRDARAGGCSTGEAMSKAEYWAREALSHGVKKRVSESRHSKDCLSSRSSGDPCTCRQKGPCATCGHNEAVHSASIRSGNGVGCTWWACGCGEYKAKED